MQSSKSDVAGLERVIRQSTEHDQRVGGAPGTTDFIRNISLSRLSGGRITA